jgi:WD40 repeat protein
MPTAPKITGPLPMVQIGLTGFGFGIALHPGGKVFAMSSGPDVLLFDIATAVQRARLSGVGEKRTLTFTPDGSSVLAGGLSKELEAWDLSTGERRVLSVETDVIFKILPVPGRGYLIGTSAGVAWRTTLDGPSQSIAAPFLQVAIHPEAPIVFGASYALVALNLESGQELWRHSTEGRGRGHELAMRNDGKAIAWSPDAEHVVLYDTRTGAPISKMSNLPGASYPQFSPSGHRLAVMGSKGVHLLDPQRRKQLTLLDGQKMSLLGFSPDSTMLGTTSSRGVHVVRADDASHVAYLPVRELLGDVRWSLDSKFVIGQLSKGRIGVWDVRADRLTTVERDSTTPRSFAWAPDGRHVLIMDWDGAYVVDAVSATITEELELPERHVDYKAAHWSADGRWLALGTTQSLFIQNRSSRDLRKILHESQYSVTRQPMFSPDGRWLLMLGTRDGHPILFSPHTGAAVKVLSSNTHPAYSGAWRSDSRAVALGGESLEVLDIDRDAVTFSASVPSNVGKVAWLGDDRLVTAHQEGEVLVWRIGQAGAEHTLQPRGVRGRHVGVSDDGRWIGAVSMYGRVSIWDAKDYRLITTDVGDGRQAQDLAWVPCSGVLSVLRGELTWFEPGGKVMSLHMLESNRGGGRDLLATRIDGAYAGSPAGSQALWLRDSGPLLSSPLVAASERPDLQVPDIGARWFDRCAGR